VVFAIRFEPGAIFFRLNHETISTQKIGGKAKAVAICSKNLIFRNYWPTVEVRCFGFIAGSWGVILAA